MVELSFLRFLYPLYRDMYVFYPFHSYFHWGKTILIFGQLIFILFQSTQPSKYFKDIEEQRFFHKILSFLYFLPWIFGTQTLKYDSIIWLIFNLLFVTFIIILAFLSYKQSYTPNCFFIWGRLYPQLIVPIFSIPLFFRISLMVERLIDNQSKDNIITLVLYCLSLIIFIFSQFISSIFLLPTFFMPESILDVYDGKSHLFLYITQFLYCVNYMLLPCWNYVPYSGLLSLVYLFLLVILLYYRMISVIHLSLFGQYIELSPLFSFPFMILVHVFGQFHWFINFLLLLFVHFVFFVLVVVVHDVMKKSVFWLFNPFIYNESLIINIPKIYILKLSSSIRLLVKYNSNPSVLVRFMEYQKQTHLRTSSFIEICRFLVIFPEYRPMMMDELNKYTSKSTYNQFILYMFKYILGVISDVKLPASYINQLEYFYSNFIVHSYLYWNSRKNKMFTKAFLECFACAYFESEGKTFIEGLLYMFPFDPNVHKYHSEMLLNFDGKYNAYKKERIHSIEIKNGHQTMLDPLLHIMSVKNPKILQYCNPEFKSSIFNSNQISEKKNHSKHKKNNKSHQKKTENIASKVIRSKRRIPYFHILNYIFPIIIALAFVIYTNSINTIEHNKRMNLIDSMRSIQQKFYSFVSSVFIPLSLIDFNPIMTNLTDEKVCQSRFNMIANIINGYYLNLPITINYSKYYLFNTFHELRNLVMKTDDVCDVVSNFFTFFYQTANNNANLIFHKYDLFLDKIELNGRNQERIYVIFVIYGSISIICFLIIYFISICITLNSIMRKEQSVIDYLSSIKRMSYIMKDPESRDNLWYLCNGIESDSSFPLELESEFETISLSTSFKNTNYSSNFHSIDQKKSIYKITKSATDLRLIPPSKITNKSSDDMNIDHSENKFHSTTFSNSSFSGSGTINKSQTKELRPSEMSKSIDDSHASDSVEVNSSLNETDKLNVDNETNLHNNELIIDELEIKTFLEKKKKKTSKYGIYSIVMKILFPWILLYLLALIVYFPLYSIGKDIQHNLKMIHCKTNDFKSAFLLVNETLRLYYEKEMNESLILDIEKKFALNETNIAELFYEVQCYTFFTIKCQSVYSIIQTILDKNYTDQFLDGTAIPILINFSESAMKSVYLGLLPEIDQPHSSPYSFIALIVVCSILFVIIGVVNTLSLRNALNSLFHFPSQSIQQKDKEDNFNEKNKGIDSNSNNNNDNDSDNKSILLSDNSIKYDLNSLINEERKYPTNIMIVTSVIESDEIYSISESCSYIINKKPSEMICKKFSKVFVLVKEMNGFKIREFNGKSFTSKSLTVGKLCKTVLIEDSKLESKNKTSNVIQKLINFMPLYFAKPFSDDFINYFHFDKSILIFTRINSEIAQIDNFFNITNRLDQAYFNIDFIRSNGSVLTYICKEIDVLEIVLFLRDLITSSEESCKKQMNNLGLKSIYLDMVDELNLTVREGDIEPEINIEEESFYELESKIYFVDDHCIGCSNDILMMINSMIKFDTAFVRHNINCISFKDFSEKVGKVIS